MEENTVIEEEVKEEEQPVNNVYTDSLEVAALAKQLYFEAMAAGEYDKGKIFFDQWKQACDKIHAFDENFTAQMKTNSEIEAKLEMNRRDNETKLQAAREELELREKMHEQDLMMQRAQLVATCVTNGLNVTLNGASMALQNLEACATMSWESNGYVPDQSKTARKMVAIGNKVTKLK